MGELYSGAALCVKCQRVFEPSIVFFQGNRRTTLGITWVNAEKVGRKK